MKTLSGLILLMVVGQSSLADETLTGNPYLPYPPACGRMPDTSAPANLNSQAKKFYGSQVEVGAYRVEGNRTINITVPMTLRAYRAPCSEPNRSLIWLEFTLSSSYAEEEIEIPLPWVSAKTSAPWEKYPKLTAEPNTWISSGFDGAREVRYLLSRAQGMDRTEGSPAGNRRWVFLLDNQSPLNEWWNPGELMTPASYNDAFKLTVHLGYDADGELTQSFWVPATRDLLPGPAPVMPLSGRLSGNWVISGATDQGLMLAISELIQADLPEVAGAEERPLIAFIAHYTFDAAGNPLWLTGAAEFRAGAQEVTIPIELVRNGEFRGGREADRETIGSVTLKSGSCDNLGFEFDYSGLGLGGGDLRLRRLLSLETAGFECRDLEARVTANR